MKLFRKYVIETNDLPC